MTINPFILHGEEITPVRKLLYLKAFAGGGALSEYEITGNPAVFQTNVAKPLSGFTIPFLPVQQGTGDPSPDNVRPIIGWQGLTAFRTGVNLLDPAKKTTSSTHIYFYKENGIYLPAGKYTLSCESQVAGIFVHAMDNTQIVTGYNNTAKSFTLSEGQTVYINFYDTNIDTTMDCQLEVGETASPYAPYTGASYPVTFPATGKNLLPITLDSLKALNTSGQWNGNVYTYNGLTFTVESDMKITVDGTASASTYFRMVAQDNEITIEPGKYVFHATGSSKFKVTLVKNGGYLTEVGLSNYTPTFTEAFTLRCYSQIASGTVFDNETFAVMAEKGETVSAYEPFDNTVYGGTLDAVNGVLTVEWAKYPLKNQSWNNFSGNVLFYKSIPKDKRSSIMCDSFPAIVGQPNAEQTVGSPNNGTNSASNLYFYKTGMANATEFREWINSLEFDPYVVYKLETPLVYQLSPVEILSLVGENTIWTDTNGENTVRYKKKG